MIYLPFALYLLLALTGCENSKQSDTPPNNTPTNDIVGVWYQVDPVNTSVPAPNTRYSGWSITRNTDDPDGAPGTIHQIGIRGNDGTVELMDTPFTYKIHEFGEGEIVMDFPSFPRPYTGTMKYSFEGDLLTLDGPNNKGQFRRTQLGEVVTDPLIANIEYTMEGERLVNPPIANMTPTAYISRISPSELRLFGNFGEVDSEYDVEIHIPDFDGPGTYTIGKNEGRYENFGIDWIGPKSVTTADSSGFITIDTYDVDQNRIAGTFGFYLYLYQDSRGFIELTDGRFDLPLFE